MKKMFLIIFMSLFAMPVFAVCSVTGEACAAPVNFEPQSLEQKLVPDHLQQMQRTDAFQENIQQPINSNTTMNTNQANSNTQTNDYNSNCQFGVCLPGSNKIENSD